MEWFVIGYKPDEGGIALAMGSFIATSYSASRYYKSPLGYEYWHTNSGKAYDSSILQRQSNGRFVRGVQGIRYSKINAKKAIRVPSALGKTLGLGSIALNIYNWDSNYPINSSIDIARSIGSYISLPYGMIDFYISTSIESTRQTQQFNQKYGLSINKGVYNPTLGQYW